MLVDTHCHIHSKDYQLESDEVIKEANEVGVNKIICIGTDVADSKDAINFSKNRDGVFAVVGVHPHDAKNYSEVEFENLVSSEKLNIVGIGEIGLDYHYDYSSREDQINAFRSQIGIAQKYGLPIVFHVREAFDDFLRIIDEFPDLPGVVHSFSDDMDHLKKVLDRGFYVGLNGIATFSKNKEQLEAFRSIPLEKLILETDAPYLTPSKYRGKINQPAYVKEVAHWVARSSDLSMAEVARVTTLNAEKIFNI